MKNYTWILLLVVIVIAVIAIVNYVRKNNSPIASGDIVRVSGIDLSFYVNQEDRLTTTGPAQRSIGTANYIITGQNIKVEYNGTGIIGQ